MTSLIKTLNSIPYLSLQNKNDFLSITTTKNLNKGEKILSLDSICRHIYFIEKGIARIYYLKNGKDITEWIAFENSYFFSIISFFHGIPSLLEIECLEDCKVNFISHEGLEKLSNIDVNISRYFRELISSSLIYSQVRMESIQFETAKERYGNLILNTPQIIQRVPLKYIASFLGISFETLSRIRAKI